MHMGRKQRFLEKSIDIESMLKCLVKGLKRRFRLVRMRLQMFQGRSLHLRQRWRVTLWIIQISKMTGGENIRLYSKLLRFHSI